MAVSNSGSRYEQGRALGRLRFGYDGAFLYSVGSLTQVPVPNTTFGGAPVTPVVRAHAGIASGLVPPHMPEIGTRLLWLMFVPRAEDSIISQGSGECIWDDPLFIKYHVTLPIRIEEDQVLVPPKRVVAWLNDGRLRYEDTNGKLSYKPWPAPYDKGYTNATLESTTTNIGGVPLPLQSTLVSYVPDYPSESMRGGVPEVPRLHGHRPSVFSQSGGRGLQTRSATYDACDRLPSCRKESVFQALHDCHKWRGLADNTNARTRQTIRSL